MADNLHPGRAWYIVAAILAAWSSGVFAAINPWIATAMFVLALINGAQAYWVPRRNKVD